MMPRGFALILALCFFAYNALAARSLRSKGSRFVVSRADELPHFSFRTFGGDSYDSDFLRGQTVLIQFASTWCSLSREQLIETELFCREMAENEHFVCIVFDVEDVAADTAAFLARSAADNLTLTMAYDEADRIYNLFATPKGSVTRSVVVDSSGRIAYLSDTYSRKAFARIKKKIRKLISVRNE